MTERDPFAPEPTLGRAEIPLRPLLLGASQATAMLGIGRSTLDAMAKRGEIRTVRIAGRVLFPLAELERIARGEERTP